MCLLLESENQGPAQWGLDEVLGYRSVVVVGWRRGPLRLVFQPDTWPSVSHLRKPDPAGLGSPVATEKLIEGSW